MPRPRNTVDKSQSDRGGNAADGLVRAGKQTALDLAVQGRAKFQERRLAAARLVATARRLVLEWDALIAEYGLLACSAGAEDLCRDPAYLQLREQLTAILLELRSDSAVTALLRAPEAEAEFGLVERHALRRLLHDPLPRAALASLFADLDEAAQEVRKAAVPDSDSTLAEPLSRRQDRGPER